MPFLEVFVMIMIVNNFFIIIKEHCMNQILIISLAAIIFTQVIKFPIAYFFNRKSAKVNIITSTGGMPSSHSAAVSSLISSLIFEYGFNSPLVAIATIFGVIIMFDSMGVRRQSGEQGIVLDELVKHYIKLHNDELDITVSEKDEDINPAILDTDLSAYHQMIVKKYLGHKPSEVIIGTLTGMLVSTFFTYVVF